MILNFAKIRDVKTPIYSSTGAAGLDFFVPYDFKSYKLLPGESILIPSGIKLNIPAGYALIGQNKSGIALKRNLRVASGVIDSDYQGEIHLHLNNFGLNEQIIDPGDKIMQFLVISVPKVTLLEINIDNLYNHSSNRGNNGFGSTGEK